MQLSNSFNSHERKIQNLSNVLQYINYSGHECGDLKVIGILLGLQK